MHSKILTMRNLYNKFQKRPFLILFSVNKVMAWYSAHLITYFKLKNRPQNSYTVWENIVLIEAVDEADALSKAEEIGKHQAKLGEDKSLTADGQPAENIFAGVRNIGTVFHTGQDGKLESGDEVSFLEYVVSDKLSIERLVKGEKVEVTLY